MGMNQPLSPVMKVGYSIPPASPAAMRRIDHRELRIRIRAVPFVKTLHAFFRRVNIRLPRALVAVIGEQPDFHWSDTAVELVLDDFEVGIGGPGEIVHVFGMEGDGLGTVAVVGIARLHTGCADDVILRQRDLHIISAEVGKELGHGMELMTIPLPMPPYSDLGEPLPGEQKSAFVSGAGDHFRKGRLELDFELHTSRPERPDAAVSPRRRSCRRDCRRRGR